MQINEKFPIFSNVSSFVFFNTTIGVLCVRIHLVKFDWGDWKKNPEDRWTTTITQEAPDTTMTQWKKKRGKNLAPQKSKPLDNPQILKKINSQFSFVYSVVLQHLVYLPRGLPCTAGESVTFFAHFRLSFGLLVFSLCRLMAYLCWVASIYEHTQQLPSRLYSSPIPSFVGFNSSRNEK